jgi:hypothetical protein
VSLESAFKGLHKRISENECQLVFGGQGSTMDMSERASPRSPECEQELLRAVFRFWPAVCVTKDDTVLLSQHYSEIHRLGRPHIIAQERKTQHVCPKESSQNEIENSTQYLPHSQTTHWHANAAKPAKGTHEDGHTGLRAQRVCYPHGPVGCVDAAVDCGHSFEIGVRRPLCYSN